MTISKTPQFLKIVLFIPFFVASLFAFYQFKKLRLESKRQSVNQYAGQKFPALPLLDKEGKTVVPDLIQSEYTIIDFWFRNCPGCIAEMGQFKDVLKGKGKKVSIISISIDANEEWQQALNGSAPAFLFITKPVGNWHHLLLNFPQEQGYKNNTQRLFEILGITGFPSFFVLDKNGIIKATPVSAVSYIKTSVSSENEFLVFLKSRSTWSSLQTLLLVLLAIVLYNLGYNFFASQIIKKRTT
jgi:cytochrome oxidase Cu insertion factor (SCO1/SenC/PrrC family)